MFNNQYNRKIAKEVNRLNNLYIKNEYPEESSQDIQTGGSKMSGYSAGTHLDTGEEDEKTLGTTGGGATGGSHETKDLTSMLKKVGLGKVGRKKKMCVCGADSCNCKLGKGRKKKICGGAELGKPPSKLENNVGGSKTVKRQYKKKAGGSFLDSIYPQPKKSVIDSIGLGKNKKMDLESFLGNLETVKPKPVKKGKRATKKGGNFMDDLKDFGRGFEQGFTKTLELGSKILPLLKGRGNKKVADHAYKKEQHIPVVPVANMPGSTMSGGNKKNKRAEIVKKVMKERGVKMIEASKIVKEEGLYTK